MISLSTNSRTLFIIILTCSLLSARIYADNSSAVTESTQEQQSQGDSDAAPYVSAHGKIINEIFIHGNEHVSSDAILHRIPCKVGQPFDTNDTRVLINNLYKDLKRFRNIVVKTEELDDEQVNLHIFVTEKPPLKKIIFQGNKKVTKQEIFKKTNIDNTPAIDEKELQTCAQTIIDLYHEKSYLDVTIKAYLELDEDNKATAYFDVTENNPSTVKQIRFEGNKAIASKELKKALFTREDWILGFMDGSGNYHPDRVSQGDKYVLEQYYQNRGYLNAKVIDIRTDSDARGNLVLTYLIEEGDQYTIGEIKAPGNDVLSEEQLLAFLPLRPGMLYSRQRLMDCIKRLEALWGNFGYLYASITPSVEPNENTKTVNLAFYSETGKEVYLNKLNILGNKKTRDKVIRRKLALEDGDLITQQKMEVSKNRVEALGYFDPRDGVNWKTTRLSDELADLDLIVKETKTGNAHIKMGTGGSQTSIMDGIKGFSAEASISDRNLFGTGVMFDATAQGSIGQQSLAFNITQPWLFDRPIFGAIDVYHKRIGYDDFRYANAMNERHTGGTITSGFVTGLSNPLLSETFVRGMVGFEGVGYDAPPVARFLSGAPGIDTVHATKVYQRVLNALFVTDEFFMCSFRLGQDKKNHPVHPSRGHAWLFQTNFGLGHCIGFYKVDLDANWYTPLIGERDLILRLHAFAGFARPMHNRFIPFRELFHIGGPASVRGFLYGQIGPQFSLTADPKVRGDSIGGGKTLFWNAELQFPITPDFNAKGVLFYDGGSGWDAPYSKLLNDTQYLLHNSFDYRHSVGVGIRMMSPMPIRIDIGFKLDPRKGESPYEVHFGMAYDF